MSDRAVTKEVIIKAIDDKVGGQYGKWYIGITNDENARREEHEANGYPIGAYDWHSWQAESLKDAQEIETYYQNEKVGSKMKGHVGGDLKSSPVFVYIFPIR